MDWERGVIPATKECHDCEKGSPSSQRTTFPRWDHPLPRLPQDFIVAQRGHRQIPKKDSELYLNFAPFTGWQSDELHHYCISFFPPIHHLKPLDHPFSPRHLSCAAWKISYPIHPLSSQTLLLRPTSTKTCHQQIPYIFNLFPQDSFHILFNWNLTDLRNLS